MPGPGGDLASRRAAPGAARTGPAPPAVPGGQDAFQPTTSPDVAKSVGEAAHERIFGRPGERSERPVAGTDVAAQSDQAVKGRTTVQQPCGLDRLQPCCGEHDRSSLCPLVRQSCQQGLLLLLWREATMARSSVFRQASVSWRAVHGPGNQ